MAPPFTFTRSMSGSSSRRQAATTEAKASLISTRSMSSIFIPFRSSSFRVAGMGPVSMITGSTPTVVWSTILARGFRPSDSAFPRSISSTAAAPSEICEELPAVILPSSLKAGLSSDELLEARVGADALIGDDRCRHSPRTARSRARSDLPPWRARRSDASASRSRRAPSAGSPTGRRSSRPRCPAARGCTSPSARAATGEPTSSTHLKPTPIGMWPMCSTPDPIATSCTPEAISAAREVHGLLRGAALAVDGRGGRLHRQPGLEPRVAAHVEHLLAVLLHAARDHVLHLGSVDPGALDDLGVGLRQAARSDGCPCSSPSPDAPARSASVWPPRSRPRGRFRSASGASSALACV